MSFTTRPPSVNILDIVPEFEPLGRTTVRLHPRKKKVADPAASKFGGQFLWPADEPWPEVVNPEISDCDRKEEGLPDGDFSIPLVRVLQLRKDEFPEVEFFPGTDILQFLWCPLQSVDVLEKHQPFVYWRNSAQLTKVMRNQPDLVKPNEHSSLVGVNACQLNPERVTEYPSVMDVDPKLERRLDDWLDEHDYDGDSYQNELSVADGC